MLISGLILCCIGCFAAGYAIGLYNGVEINLESIKENE